MTGVSHQTVLYVCDEIYAPTKDIRLITLKPLNEPMHFQPGQYIEAHLPDGQTLPLSLANVPTADGKLTFHLRIFPGTLAIAFVEAVADNRPLALQGPYGTAVLAQITKHHMPLFVAGGVGFAPIQGLLSTLLAQTPQTPCHLFWGIKHSDDLYALPLLKQWQAAHPHFKYTLILSDLDCPHWTAERGLVHHAVVKQYPSLAQMTVFACGPQAMIDAAFPLFQKHELSKKQFISDSPVSPPLTTAKA